MTTLISTPSCPGDRHRRVFSISGDAATLAREYFLAEIDASVENHNPERAAIYTRHLVRICRKVNK